MATQRVVTVNSNGDLAEIVPNTTSAGAADSGKLLALNALGQIDQTALPDQVSSTFTASEAIAAGAFVNIWNSAGAIKVRNADASVPLPIHGFAPAAISNAGTGTIITGPASNQAVAGLTIGSTYFLGLVGAVTTVVNTTAGQICQKIGVAKSATELEWLNYPPVLRA